MLIGYGLIIANQFNVIQTHSFAVNLILLNTKKLQFTLDIMYVEPLDIAIIVNVISYTYLCLFSEVGCSSTSIPNDC